MSRNLELPLQELTKTCFLFSLAITELYSRARPTFSVKKIPWSHGEWHTSLQISIIFPFKKKVIQKGAVSRWHHLAEKWNFQSYHHGAHIGAIEGQTANLLLNYLCWEETFTQSYRWFFSVLLQFHNCFVLLIFLNPGNAGREPLVNH